MIRTTQIHYKSIKAHQRNTHTHTTKGMISNEIGNVEERLRLRERVSHVLRLDGIAF